MTKLFRILCLVFLSLSASPLFADADVSGRWKGAIQTPQAPLQVEVDFVRDGDGWKGDITVPQQKSVDRPLEVVVEGWTVTFRMPKIPGDPTFHGSVAANSKLITGDFTQNGKKFRFRLERE